MSDFTQAPEFARARALFEQEFGTPAPDARQLAVYAPGRSEIAGNHTDHEGGHVIAGALNVARTKVEAKAHHEAEARAAAQALADKIKDKTVVVKVKGGASGKLYGKVTSKDVADALTKLIGAEVDKKKVEMQSNIKEFGSYDAAVRLYQGVSASFKVKVEEL